MPDIDLDVRFLDPPEPFEKTIEALDQLGAGDTLCLLIHREPHPLYPILRTSGFDFRATQGDDGMWTILIRHAAPGRV